MVKKQIPHDLTLIAFEKQPDGTLCVHDIVTTSRKFAPTFTRRWAKDPLIHAMKAFKPVALGAIMQADEGPMHWKKRAPLFTMATGYPIRDEYDSIRGTQYVAHPYSFTTIAGAFAAARKVHQLEDELCAKVIDYHTGREVYPHEVNNAEHLEAWRFHRLHNDLVF